MSVPDTDRTIIPTLAREVAWNENQRNRIQANDPTGEATDLEVDSTTRLKTVARIDDGGTVEGLLEQIDRKLAYLVTILAAATGHDAPDDLTYMG